MKQVGYPNMQRRAGVNDLDQYNGQRNINKALNTSKQIQDRGGQKNPATEIVSPQFSEPRPLLNGTVAGETLREMETARAQSPLRTPGNGPVKQPPQTPEQQRQRYMQQQQKAIGLNKTQEDVLRQQTKMMQNAEMTRGVQPVKEQKKAGLRQLFARVRTGNVTPEQAEDAIMTSNQFSREERRKLLMYMWQNQEKFQQSKQFGM